MNNNIENSIAELTKCGSAIGLRAQHFEDILKNKPAVGWLEAHSENFFGLNSISTKYLDKIKEIYPISLHGVGMSLGSSDGLDIEHLRKLKKLIDKINPHLVSEHLSWNMLSGQSVPDLLPIPLNEESFQIVKKNVNQMQDFIERQILVENPSAYMNFKGENIYEPDFLNRLADETGCRLLLDINNIEVSCHNLDTDKKEYIDSINGNYVGEIHLAGYQLNIVDGNEIFIDAHNNHVYDNVWKLYEYCLQKIGDKPSLIEWDNDIPELDILVAEAKKADVIRGKVKAVKK